MPSYFDNIGSEAPRSMAPQISHPNILRCLWGLAPSSKISRRALRYIYGKKFKHMTRTGAQFKLNPTSTPQVWEIYWKGKKLGDTHPYSSINDSTAEDLWLLATGPSVKPLDLSRLQGQSILGVNGAIAICQQHQITPQYYTCFDRKFFEERMHLVKEAVLSGAHCFFSFTGISRICEHAPEIIAQGKISLLEASNHYYGHPKISDSELIINSQADPDLSISPAQPTIGWSKDIRKGVFDSRTIAYSACQIASHLRAKQVFILGMDLGSSTNQAIRAYESGDQACPSSLDQDYNRSILPAFQFLSELNLPTQFLNVSPDSRLPDTVLQKISFEDALQRAAKTPNA